MTQTEIIIKEIIKLFCENNNGLINVKNSNDIIKKNEKQISAILSSMLYKFDNEENRNLLFQHIKMLPEINRRINIELRKEKLDKINGNRYDT